MSHVSLHDPYASRIEINSCPRFGRGRKYSPPYGFRPIYFETRDGLPVTMLGRSKERDRVVFLQFYNLSAKETRDTRSIRYENNRLLIIINGEGARRCGTRSTGAFLIFYQMTIDVTARIYVPARWVAGAGRDEDDRGSETASLPCYKWQIIPRRPYLPGRIVNVLWL